MTKDSPLMPVQHNPKFYRKYAFLLMGLVDIGLLASDFYLFYPPRFPLTPNSLRNGQTGPLSQVDLLSGLPFCECCSKSNTNTTRPLTPLFKHLCYSASLQTHSISQIYAMLFQTSPPERESATVAWNRDLETDI